MTLPPHHPFRSAAAREAFLTHYEARAAELPVPTEEQFVETSLGPTFVRACGPKEAPPLVLLHGVSGSSLQWAPNLKAFSREYRVFAVDCIHDCGKSAYKKLAKSGADYAVWLGEVFDGLGLQAGIHLAGLSYGGWMSAMFALRSPERLSSLVLLATANTVLPISAAWMARAIACALPAKYFTKSFLYWLLADVARQGEEGKKTVEEWIEDSHLAMRSFAPKRIVPPTVLSDAELSGLAVRTLFLVGENEKIYDPRAAIERVKRVAPRVDTALISGAGHDLTIAQARVCEEKIIAFLRGSSA